MKSAVWPHSDKVRNIISLLALCSDIDLIVVNVIINICTFPAVKKLITSAEKIGTRSQETSEGQ